MKSRKQKHDLFSGKSFLLKLILLLFVINVFCFKIAYADDSLNSQDTPVVLGRQITVQPQGEYAKIEVKKSNEMMEDLVSSEELLAQRSMQEVLNYPGDYNPVVLCAVSHIFAEQGRTKEAIFWFYACQLRALSDAYKTNELSSRDAVTVLTRDFISVFDQSSNLNEKDLKQIKESVIIWDNTTPRNYDPRWLMLHGLGGFFSDKPIDFAKGTEWKKIDSETRKIFSQEENITDAVLDSKYFYKSNKNSKRGRSG